MQVCFHNGVISENSKHGDCTSEGDRGQMLSLPQHPHLCCKASSFSKSKQIPPSTRLSRQEWEVRPVSCFTNKHIWHTCSSYSSSRSPFSSATFPICYEKLMHSLFAFRIKGLKSELPISWHFSSYQRDMGPGMSACRAINPTNSSLQGL